MSNNGLQQELENTNSGASADSRSDGLADSLIRVNALDYKLPSNMSVVTARSMKRSFANLDSYSAGGKIIITWNTGTDYVDGINSYLMLNFQQVGAASSCSFGSGSSVNLIDSVTITSRSGVEIERQEGVGVMMRDIVRYDCSQDYIDSFGQVIGFGQSVNTMSVASNYNFCIPLNLISGLCNQRKLLPSHLAGGLRFEIQLSTVGEALYSSATAPTGYTLTNVSMMLDCYNLADSIQKKLTQRAASDGLEVYFETRDRTKYSFTASKANVVVRKAVSRCLSAFAKTRITANTTLVTADSVGSENGSLINYMQWRLGSIYFPNQPITSSEELYFYAQYAFDKIKHCHKASSVSLTDFKNNEALACVTCERSSVLGLSGLPLNASRELQLEIKYSTEVARDVDIWMSYLKLVRVYINNAVVKE